MDYYDTDGSPKALGNQFRDHDFEPVGTQQGNIGDVVVSLSGSTLIGYPNTFAPQTYDTQRAKYSAVNPALQEYNVRRIDGGEWLNYTREFSSANYYYAYLRVAAGIAHPVRLDQVEVAGANTLGWFRTQSTFFLNNYRYVPLTTASGAPAVINLGGTAKLRLLMDFQAADGNKQGLALNYLVLVPALPQVLSASTVNGDYALESNGGRRGLLAAGGQPESRNGGNGQGAVQRGVLLFGVRRC